MSVDKEYPSDEVVVLRETIRGLEQDRKFLREMVEQFRGCLNINAPKWEDVDGIYASGKEPKVVVSIIHEKMGALIQDEYAHLYEFDVVYTLSDPRFQKAAALVREALEVAKNAYEEGQGSQSFPWSMASANLAAENIEKALETLEKEA